MEIYRMDNRLSMIMEVEERFSFEAKNKEDQTNQIVQDWEALMWKHQQAMPVAKEGEKWILAEEIFSI